MEYLPSLHYAPFLLFIALSLYTESPVFCEILKITNSAGFTGAMPMTQTSLPLSISSWLMVFLPQLTKMPQTAQTLQALPTSKGL